jgi:hypothetical protein
MRHRPADRLADPVADGRGRRHLVAVGLGRVDGVQPAAAAGLPSFIAPLFNKFQPLEDETLKARVTALMQRCGFAAKGLFVMDGSKRSAHANAYFTGFGAAKRVVFYDTCWPSCHPARWMPCWPMSWATSGTST